VGRLSACFPRFLGDSKNKIQTLLRRELLCQCVCAHARQEGQELEGCRRSTVGPVHYVLAQAREGAQCHGVTGPGARFQFEMAAAVVFTGIGETWEAVAAAAAAAGISFWTVDNSACTTSAFLTATLKCPASGFSWPAPGAHWQDHLPWRRTPTRGTS
jgi:hypothetical protein